MNGARSPRPGILGFALLALALPASAQDVKDTIKLKDGKTETGKISREEYGGVTIAGAKTLTIPWASVQSVTYGGSPEYNKAMSALSGGNLDDALGQLERLYQDKKLRPFLRQGVLYHLGVLEQRQGKHPEALARFEELAKDSPKSRYLRPMAEGVVASYLAQGNADGAMKALEKIVAQASAAGVEAGFEAEVGLLKARVNEGQKKYAEARIQYESAARAAGGTPATAQEARLGLARCTQAEGKKTEALDVYKKLTLEDAPNRVLAGAWNGFADITMDEGVAKKDPGILLDALYGYLRGVVQYGPAPSESANEYEHSLAGSAKCFKYISELEQNQERKKAYAARARDREEQLRKEFPSSPYLAGSAAPVKQPAPKAPEKK